MAKLILDPSADGYQWVYRGSLVIKQDHPELLKYCCQTIDDEFIGVSNTKSGCKVLIDSFIIMNNEKFI